MKIVIIDWVSYHLKEIASFFENHGMETVFFREKPRNYHYDPVFRKSFSTLLETEKIDVVFSIQFFPILSGLCQKAGKTYISWCYTDALSEYLISKSAGNPCNIIFHMDSFFVDKLNRTGICQAFFLPPAAVLPVSTDSPGTTGTTHGDVPYDISFFHAAQPEKYQNYRYLLSQADEHDQGFYNGILHAQKTIYGFNFLEKILYDDYLPQLRALFPYKASSDSLVEPEEHYAYHLLYPAIDYEEMDEISSRLSALGIRLYSHYLGEKTDREPGNGLPDSEDKPKEPENLYRSGKINILYAPREIQNGIMPQAMDILGTGNMLLTNFQNDYSLFFTPEKDYIYYESIDDLMEKASYYLEHEEEREKIARHAKRTVKKDHTLETRLETMLELCKGGKSI